MFEIREPDFIMRFCPKCRQRMPMRYWSCGGEEAPYSVKCAGCKTEWIVDDNDNLIADFIEGKLRFHKIIRVMTPEGRKMWRKWWRKEVASQLRIAMTSIDHAKRQLELAKKPSTKSPNSTKSKLGN